MRDYLEVGSAPYGEDCAQVGTEGYSDKSSKECETFIKQLERTFPNAPDGFYFSKKGFPHDFGTYYEVVMYYDDDKPDHVKFAFMVDDNVPKNWDDQSKKELGL